MAGIARAAVVRSRHAQGSSTEERQEGRQDPQGEAGRKEAQEELVAPDFLPGRQLAAAFYADAVAPLLRGVPHAAGFFGWGSDVLGYDTERSTDHGWGPRLSVFVEADLVESTHERLDELPATFLGWPVRFGWDAVEARHHVMVSTLSDVLLAQLGFDPRDQLSTFDWLLTPQELLLEFTSGTIFRDEGGDLSGLQSLLAWYPVDVWLWIIACQWQRLSQEEAFVGRAAEVGDELGSQVMAARLARDVMRLCFLLERRYAPYGKWLGTAFAALDAAQEVGPALEQALTARDYAKRERGLVAAYESVARRHNELRLTDPVDPTTQRYHGRPYQVLHAERFVGACTAQITDPVLSSLPLVGAVDQFCDSTDILSHSTRPRQLGSIYGQNLGDSLLGTGSPLPDPRRAGPATLVRAGGATLLFDCGRGVLSRLVGAGSAPPTLTAVFLTHLHSDHITDLNDVITTNWVMSLTPTRLPISGPPGTREVVDATLAFLAHDIGYRIAHHADITEGPRLDVTEASDGDVVYDAGGVVVRVGATDHRPVEPTVGYRIEHDSRSVVIAGDTVPCEGLDRLCAGADALVHTVIRDDIIRGLPLPRMREILGYHSSIADAAQTATRAGVATLVLTHYIPALQAGDEQAWIDQAAAHFDGTIELGDDLHSVTV